MKLAQPKVKFAGYMVGISGIEVDPDKIEAVWKFPTPATRQDLKSFMGLINQFRQFNQAVTKSSYILKPLLSTKAQYMWLPEHQKAFDELKENYPNHLAYLISTQIWKQDLKQMLPERRGSAMRCFRGREMIGN